MVLYRTRSHFCRLAKGKGLNMGFFADRKWAKQVEKAKGLDKLRLLVRDTGTHFSMDFSKRMSGFEGKVYAMSLINVQQVFADYYYKNKSFTLKRFNVNEETYCDKSVSKINNYETNKLIGARLFGAAISISVCKAAEMTNTRVKLYNIYRFIDNGSLEPQYKQAMKEAIEYVTNHISGDIVLDGSQMIGGLAMLLENEHPIKGHYVDPFLFSEPIEKACLSTYRQIDITPTIINGLLKLQFIG